LTEYTTVSFPKTLIDDITKLVEEVGYWPSTAAFAREALVEKLQAYREAMRAVTKEAEG